MAYEYHMSRRKVKLFQIESAISGNSSAVYRSLGVSAANMQAVKSLNLNKKFINPEEHSPEQHAKIVKLMDTI